DVGGGDGDAARLLLGSVVDRVEAAELDLRVVLGQHLGDGRRESRLAVVDVADGADVDVRLGAIKFLFRHVSILTLSVRMVVDFRINWHNASRDTVQKPKAHNRT